MIKTSYYPRSKKLTRVQKGIEKSLDAYQKGILQLEENYRRRCKMAYPNKDRGKFFILHTRIIVVKNEELTLFLVRDGEDKRKKSQFFSWRGVFSLDPPFNGYPSSLF